ncbi:hypothetical protein A7U60_g8241 [Sanghuangporus baumii]|uniref:Large ribosomal subunit protein uL30m n=1 Tax=Sanghuangporus baumii TaxID=108892 RepID=A0A9Q5HRL6_SANBA|nr:hypothetical protein A7U60_g8241 [Sanghuangporus baumii]
MLPRSRVIRPRTGVTPPRRASLAVGRRSASSSSPSSSSTSGSTPQPEFSSTTSPPPQNANKTYFKITLTRSAIGLGASKKSTLASLGIHRRMQTVFHPHKPEFAGKILAVKELVRVENVSGEEVRSKEELRRMRRPQSGFEVVGRVGEGLV